MRQNMVCRWLVMVGAFLLTALAGKAQTFYELTFHAGEEREEFVGLLIYADDEHCKMRIVDSEAVETNSCYEANYTSIREEKENADDVGTLLMVPDDEEMPTLIWYWEKDDESDMCEAPYLAFDLEDVDSWIQTESFQEVTLADMDEEYVGQFYGEDEPEYALLLQGARTMKKQSSAAAAPTDSQATLHLIIAANTNVSDIGPACSIDLRRIRSEFGGVSKALGLTLDEHVVSGENYSKEQVAKVLGELKVGWDDVVVFAYSGHGFRFKNQQDYYPCLDLTATAYDKLNENYLPLHDIHRQLTALGARLTVVLSDCCNSEVSEQQPLVMSNSLFSRANTNFDLAKLNRLFLQSRGNVLATAASPGEYSWCGTNGGFFLLSFFENLRSQISALNQEVPSWDALISKTIESAAKKTENNQNCKKQNGLKEVAVETR